jgi:hypothetical protein
MSKRGFWTAYPQKWWSKADWEAWDKAGRPRVPVGMRLDAELPSKPLDPTPLAGPPVFNGFDLYAPGRPRGQSARSASIDRLLAKLGVR